VHARVRDCSQLPPGIDPEAAAVPQIVVANGQALCVVAQLVLAQQADRPCETHLHAQVDQQVFEPARTLETVVHQLAMAAQRVAEQQTMAVLTMNNASAPTLTVSAPPTSAAAAMPRNQAPFNGEKRTTPLQTSPTSRCRTRNRPRLAGSADDEGSGGRCSMVKPEKISRNRLAGTVIRSIISVKTEITGGTICNSPTPCSATSSTGARWAAAGA
jgi:hypothetical protein